MTVDANSKLRGISVANDRIFQQLFDIGTREQLIANYKKVRELTRTLVAPLSPEDQQLQSMDDASPTKWHLAHTSWFFEIFVLKDYLEGYGPYTKEFAYLYNSYYQSIGPQYDRPKRGVISRPSVDEIVGYRKWTDEKMLECIANVSDRDFSKLYSLVTLGINHEQQHQELLLTDIKHAFSLNPLYPKYKECKREKSVSAPLDWLSFDGGQFRIGYEGKNFSYDNEGPAFDMLLQPYQLASRLVTNREFLAFIEDGGYENPTFWLSDGWYWVNRGGIKKPLYWQKEGKWHYYTLGGYLPIEMDEPVCHVSFFEADAFARWSGARLPTEFEWEVACPNSISQKHLLNLDCLHPKSECSHGLVQMIGDVWEWTSSPYTGFPNFNPVQGPIGEYNGKFMCNQIVLKGGSCVTPLDHIRSTYRNFFPPEIRWQFCGFRLAK
ncbi:MAG: ergothioneine biosynthesis protein EgtB [Chlamydiota bacterium]|nr:ergothioneine biosynthesis protein EgtB [Chlamydiota bacterium]